MVSVLSELFKGTVDQVPARSIPLFISEVKYIEKYWQKQNCRRFENIVYRIQVNAFTLSRANELRRFAIYTKNYSWWIKNCCS